MRPAFDSFGIYWNRYAYSFAQALERTPRLMRSDDPSEHGTDVAAAFEVDQRHVDQLTFDQLNAEAGSLRRRNPPQALELAQRALSLTERLEYSHGQLQALPHLAHGALDTADYAAAERLARVVQAVALTSGAVQARAAASVVLGIVYTSHGDFEAALEAHGASRALYRELGNRSGEAEALMYTGGVYLDLTRYTEAHGYLTGALDIFAEQGNLSGQMQAHLMLGITAGALGELAASFQHNLRALELSEQEGHLLTQLRVLNNLVNSYSASAESDKALAYSLRALELTEVLGNLQMRAALLVNVATTYLNLGELDRALGYADEALELTEQRGYLRDRAEAYETLGRLYLLKGEPERAQGCFRGALETAQAAGDRHAEAVALTSLAELAQRRGQLGEAHELFGESVATARLTDNTLAEIGARLGLGKLLAAQGEEEGARGELQRAVRLAHRHDTKRQLCDAYLALSESFERDGQLREALDTYKRYAEVGRRFSHERIAERTAALTGQLELERAEKRAELERFKNTELAQANAALQRTLDENTTLLAKLQEQALRLERQTREDALTGLANRRHLEERPALEFGRAT